MPEDKRIDSDNLVHQFLEASQEQAAKNAEKEALRRRGLWVALALTVVALLLAVFALISRQGAIRQMEQAELRRAQAEDLIDFMLSDMKDKLDSVGRLDVLEDVGTKAMAYFATVSEAELSGETLAKRIQAMHRLGEVRFQQNDKKGALEVFGKALSDAEKLALRSPNHSDWQYLLVVSYFWMASVHQADYNAAAGLPYCEAYQKVAERMFRANPDDETWQYELACAYQNMGVALRADNRWLEALDVAHRNMQITRDLWEKYPDDLTYKGDLADSLNWRGILLRNSDISASISDHKMAKGLLLDIVKVAPKDKTFQYLLQNAQRILAKSLRFDCQPAQALIHTHQAMAIIEQLIQHDPSNAEWSDAYAQTHITLASTYELMDQPDLAEKHLATAHQYMMSTDYYSQVTRRTMGKKRARNVQARLHLALGDYGDAFNLAFTDTCDVSDISRLTPEMRELYTSNLVVLAWASRHLDKHEEVEAALEVLMRDSMAQENLSLRTAQALAHVHEVLWGDADNPSTPAPCF